MKTKADIVHSWLRKADSDLANIRACLAAEEAFDTACSHAQQAAEKVLKAYLVAHDIEFPFLHNIEKLLEMCAQKDPAFLEFMTIGQEFTPYAVELRYDEEFWPDRATVTQALAGAERIRDFVRARLSGV